MSICEKTMGRLQAAQCAQLQHAQAASGERAGDRRGGAEDFHARFSATRRHYLYRILNRRAPPALDRGKVWRLPVDLDAEAMHARGAALVGKHDFTTFRAAQCQAKSPVKTLDRLDVARYGELIELAARCPLLPAQPGPLHGGLAPPCGRRQMERADLKRALDAADRARGGPAAPPDGLYLVEVRYQAAGLT